jgi:hypothetical protein
MSLALGVSIIVALKPKRRLFKSHYDKALG